MSEQGLFTDYTSDIYLPLYWTPWRFSLFTCPLYFLIKKMKQFPVCCAFILWPSCSSSNMKTALLGSLRLKQQKLDVWKYPNFSIKRNSLVRYWNISIDAMTKQRLKVVSLLLVAGNKSATTSKWFCKGSIKYCPWKKCNGEKNILHGMVQWIHYCGKHKLTHFIIINSLANHKKIKILRTTFLILCFVSDV